MLNKKIILAVALISTISSSCFADDNTFKTKGHLLNIGAIYTDIDANANANDGGYKFSVPSISYQYNYNFGNKFFIAPGAFFNNNDTENEISLINVASSVTDTSGYNNKTVHNIKYSYGTTLDFGYDVSNRLVGFLRLGYSIADIESNEFSPTLGERALDAPGYTQKYISYRNVAAKKDSTKGSFLYGFGSKFSLNENVKLGINYEIQKFKNLTSGGSTDKTDLKVHILGLNLGYNF
jgi:opacity protein-like surface antigen